MKDEQEDGVSRTQLTFSYWSDPMCIWAYVAQSKLERLLRSTADALLVEYRVVPVFGSVRWRLHEGPWASGGVKARIAATRRVALEHGCPEVSGECWAGELPSSSWAASTPAKAIGVLEEMGQVGPGSVGAYLRELRTRFFAHDDNIAKREVQLSVAEALNLPRGPIETRLDDGTALAALWEDHNERERLRIQGSPTYVFDGGRAMLYGNFDFGVLQATVEQLLSGARAHGTAC